MIYQSDVTKGVYMKRKVIIALLLAASVLVSCGKVPEETEEETEEETTTTVEETTEETEHGA